MNKAFPQCVHVFLPSNRIRSPRILRRPGIVKETAPLPVFRVFAQSTLHRVAMNIPEHLHELAMIPDVEIIVSLLPEVLCLATQPPRNSLLEGLHDIRERSGSFSPTQANPFGYAQGGLEWGTVGFADK